MSSSLAGVRVTSEARDDASTAARGLDGPDVFFETRTVDQRCDIPARHQTL
jgi:hypothetical protein